MLKHLYVYLSCHGLSLYTSVILTCRDREGLEGDRERMLMAAQNAEKARSGYAGDLEALEAEQQRLENLARAKQQEYMDARNSAQKVAQQVADLKYAPSPPTSLPGAQCALCF